ncbi:VG15 protein [Amycolatopsis sp. NPDC004368]
MPASGAAAAQSMRHAQLAVAAQAVLEAKDLWDLVNPLTPFDQFLAWLQQMARLIDRTRRLSVQTAQAGYNELRRQQTSQLVTYALPDVAYTPDAGMLSSVLATGPGRMRQLLKQGYAPEQAHRDAFPLLSGVVTKQTLDAGRDAVEQATRDDSEAVGWARVTRPKACGWCLALASRGAVYHSEADATKVTGGQRGRPRGPQDLGNTYHPDCRCFAVPVFSGDQGLPELNQQMADAWAASTSGLSGKEALAAFRAYVGAEH